MPSAGRHATLREVYYRLKPLELFRSYADVAQALQEAVSVLEVPRSRLGIACSDKGLVAGRLVIHDRHSGGQAGGQP